MGGGSSRLDRVTCMIVCSIRQWHQMMITDHSVKAASTYTASTLQVQGICLFRWFLEYRPIEFTLVLTSQLTSQASQTHTYRHILLKNIVRNIVFNYLHTHIHIYIRTCASICRGNFENKYFELKIVGHPPTQTTC